MCERNCSNHLSHALKAAESFADGRTSGFTKTLFGYRSIKNTSISLLCRISVASMAASVNDQRGPRANSPKVRNLSRRACA
jgi:hypothetical protein